MDILKSYFCIPKSGVIGIFNNRNKQFLIVSSVHLRESLIGILSNIENETSPEYRNMKDELEDLSLEILDTELLGREVGIRYWWYIDTYEKQGYVPYSRNTRMPKYECKIVPTLVNHAKPEVQVVLENRRGGRSIVGTFDNVLSAEKWKQKHYGDGVQRIILLEE